MSSKNGPNKYLQRAHTRWLVHYLYKCDTCCTTMTSKAARSPPASSVCVRVRARVGVRMRPYVIVCTCACAVRQRARGVHRAACVRVWGVLRDNEVASKDDFSGVADGAYVERQLHAHPLRHVPVLH
jgi:hypothetical protein